MRIIVTGGSGLIGSRTVARLVADGHTVVSIDCNLRRVPGVLAEVADLRRRESLYPLLDGADAVVHLANHANSYAADPQTLLAENMAINVNVCQAAVELGVGRIVFASSIQTISGVPRDPGPEQAPSFTVLPADGDTPPQPGNIYGLSKQLTEQMLAHYTRLHGLSTVAIRFPWVVSRPRQLRFFKSQERAGNYEPHELVSWLWVEDAAALISAVVTADLPGFRVYLPTGPLPAERGSPEDYARQHYPDVPRRDPGRALEALIDISRITRETGWLPSALDDVLAKVESTEP